nr:zinc finger protein with KRAB and SCAN domains 1-like isoform X3 [Leptinotarsa decemlineata]
MESNQPEVNITAQTMALNVVPIKANEMIKEVLEYLNVPEEEVNLEEARNSNLADTYDTISLPCQDFNISWQGVGSTPLLANACVSIPPPCQDINISWQGVGSTPLLANACVSIPPPCQDINISSQKIEGGPLLSNRYEVITPSGVDSVGEGLGSAEPQPFCIDQEEAPACWNQLVEPTPKKHRCDCCDKCFKYSSHLKQHIRVAHTGGQSLRCITCGKRFLNDDTLHRHMQKHLGDKPFKCSDCPKQYSHKVDLKRHIMSHTGSKPHICGICGKDFSRRDHMENHYRVHAKKVQKPLG